MKLGDIVVSYDFPGITDCYMVGKVVGIFKYDGTFRAKFVKRVWRGETQSEKYKIDYFTAPMQGNAFGDSTFKRIRVIA